MIYSITAILIPPPFLSCSKGTSAVVSAVWRQLEGKLVASGKNEISIIAWLAKLSTLVLWIFACSEGGGNISYSLKPSLWLKFILELDAYDHIVKLQRWATRMNPSFDRREDPTIGIKTNHIHKDRVSSAASFHGINQCSGPALDGK